jgi:3-hydroxyacyl-CoA dehydrogenase
MNAANVHNIVVVGAGTIVPGIAATFARLLMASKKALMGG